MSTPHPLRRSGFTLIEVAIALALFVIGALAIVRIFPPALGVIRNNESRATAVSMGESTLATLRGREADAPDAVYDGDSTTWNDIASSVTGTATTNDSLPQNVLGTGSALDHFKFVRGEKHTARTGGWALLRFSATGTPTAYQEDTLLGVQIGVNGALDFSNATLKSNGNSFFDSDGTTGHSSRPSTSYRMDSGVTYYVSYHWRGLTNGRINSVIDEPIRIPTDAGWNGDAAKVAFGFYDTGTTRIIPGNVAVRIRYPASVTPTYNSVYGLVYNLTAGQTYSFDYTVSDWRWLVYDDAPHQESSGSTTYISYLPVDGIATDDAPPYYGLLISASAVPASSAISMRTKTGEALYTIGSTPTWARTRTVFKAIDGWTHQLAVAAKSYTPFYTNSEIGTPRTSDGFLPREAWREYSYQPDDIDNSTSEDSQYIYFHASEAGKTVSVSFEYRDTSNIFHKVSNSIVTIDDIVPAPSSVSSEFAPSGKVSRAKLTELNGSDTPYGATAILSIQGLSIQARTAWLNNDRYNQVIVPGYRSLVSGTS